MSLIPVTLLTGFLGSGKSTLLSQILRDDAFANTAVIVNEFGEIGLDDFLVTHSEEQTVEMTTGCLCCTVRGDITQTLIDLFEKRKSGQINAFDRVIIETTGLADPAPVIHTLIAEPRIAKRFMLGGVVCTIDSVNGLSTLDKHEECQKQVAVADRIVYMKSDIEVDEAASHDLYREIKKLNPLAKKQDRHAVDFNLSHLFDTTLYDPQKDRYDLERWLNDQPLHDHDHHHTHSHHHHHHDGTIDTFSIIFEDPLPSNAFLLAMQLLISNQGKDILRIKGIVCLKEQPERPIVLHGVQHVFHEPLELDAWPGEDRRTRLVFITRNIPQQTINLFFKTWMSYDDEQVLEMSR
jgi:G3E family GTPase